MFQEVWPHLFKLAKAGKSPVAKVSGVEALAMVCFCCSEDPVSTHEIMGQLQGLWKQGKRRHISLYVTMLLLLQPLFLCCPGIPCFRPPGATTSAAAAVAAGLAASEGAGDAGVLGRANKEWMQHFGTAD